MARLVSRFAAIVLLAGVAVATPAIAGQLIVRSAGPSAKIYPPGKQLPDNAKLELRAGDSITLLGPGSTRTLRGPGSFSASGGDVALAANRRARFGALRTGELKLNPSPWNIDVSQGGKVCVVSSSKPTLWRPNSSDAAKLTIRGTGGQAASLDWDAGRATLDWPASLPVVDGAEYQLEFPESGETAKLTLATMPGIPTEVMDTAQALIERGCEAQLQLLVNGVDKAN
jgi:hypothetical protein